MKLTGGCRCGAVAYSSTIDLRVGVYACHCLHCQAWSSSSFALHALVPGDALILNGPTVRYGYEEGGICAQHYLCEVCHTRLYNTTSAAPGIWVIRAGTLDTRATLTPIAHIWVKHKQPWLSLPAGVPTWPESPTPEAFAAALNGVE
ncbi:GFA family protein [Pseudomonas sp. S2_C03]